MTKTELKKFRKILEARQVELIKVLRNRDAIAIEKSADALDEVQHAAERELAIRNLDRESNLLVTAFFGSPPVAHDRLPDYRKAPKCKDRINVIRTTKLSS